MDAGESKDVFEENLKRALGASVPAADPDFEARLVKRVSAEVSKSKPKSGFVRRYGLPLAVAAAVLLAVGIAKFFEETPVEKAGRVINLYGLTTIENGETLGPVGDVASVRPGQRVKTAWGSNARILLPDRSVVRTRQNTTVKIDDAPSGAMVSLEKGSVGIVAARQAEGKRLLIETPGGRVKVLGTVLDVHILQKPDGTLQSEVRVDKGLVEVASAGKTIPIPAGTFAVLSEGLAPVRRSQTPEVNDLLYLWETTQRLAEAKGLQAAFPAIIDFNGDASTVWLICPLENDGAAPVTKYALELKSMVTGVKVFSMDGAPLSSRSLAGTIEIDLADKPLARGTSCNVIVKVPGIAGPFQQHAPGVFSFAGEGEIDGVLRCFEFRLPEYAAVKDISPQPHTTRRAHGRLAITVVNNLKYPDILK